MGVAAECDTGRLRGKFGFKSFLQDRELASSVGGVNILNRIDQRGNLHREVCRVSGFSIVQQLVSYSGDVRSGDERIVTLPKGQLPLTPN